MAYIGAGVAQSNGTSGGGYSEKTHAWSQGASWGSWRVILEQWNLPF